MFCNVCALRSCQELGMILTISKITMIRPKGILYIICSLIHVSYVISDTPMIQISQILDNFIRASQHLHGFGPKGTRNYSLERGNAYLLLMMIQIVTSTYCGPSKTFRDYFKQRILSLGQSQPTKRQT